MYELSVGKADAVMIPTRYKVGRRLYNRIDSITLLAATILGSCRDRPLITIREVPGLYCEKPEVMCFCSRDRFATLLYPKNDPRGRRGPRYRWEGNGDLALGYLLDPDEKAILYDGK